MLYKIGGCEYISEDDFRDIWLVRTQPSGDLFFYSQIKDLPTETVWTIGDDDLIDEDGYTDGNWYAAPGTHFVNALGYVVTEKRWDDDTPHAIYYLDDDEEKREERRLEVLEEWRQDGLLEELKGLQGDAK